MPKRTIGYFIQRHSRARKAVRETYWHLNDRPSCFRQCIQPAELWSAGGPTFPLFGGSIYTRERLAEAVENYISYCRKKRRWSHYHDGTPKYVEGKPFYGPKFDATSLKAFREKVKSYEALLDKLLADQAAKDEKSGRTAALLAASAAEDAELAAQRDLERYVRNSATVGEIGRYAAYLQSAVNNDFDYHRAQRDKRLDRQPSPVPVPSFNTILSISERLQVGALTVIARAMTRCAGSRRK